jgi:carbamoyl-phosphate synthase large subunit
MEHIEEAGIHSGDSACAIPPYSLEPAIIDEVKRMGRAMAIELGVIGLMNMQLAVHGEDIYVLEVNPRASRTVPFVAKAVGTPLAKIAAKLQVGKTLAELGITEVTPKHVSVKESVFPFVKFDDVDTLLGPEMRSTGEVMGFDESFGMAFAKAEISAGAPLPMEGAVCVTVNDRDKTSVTPIIRRFHDLGFSILATEGTAKYLRARGIPATSLFKVGEGRPNIVDRLISGDIQLLINTPLGKKSQFDDYAMRRMAIVRRTPYCTTLSAASAACDAVIALRSRRRTVRTLQERFRQAPAETRAAS